MSDRGGPDLSSKAADDEEKGSISMHEDQIASPSLQAPPSYRPPRDLKHADEAAQVLAKVTEKVVLTPEEDKRILRKIDIGVLPVMLVVYFLQQLDKSSLSYTSVFGIVDEAHLVGTQYSWLSSVVYLAQLILQPLSSYALVRLPVGKWVGSTAASSILCSTYTNSFVSGSRSSSMS